MKKLGILSAILATCLTSCVAVMVAQKDTSPLKGNLKTVTITKESFVTNRIERPQPSDSEQLTFKLEQSYENVTSIGEQSLTITNAQKLQELAETMKVVREARFGGSHSMEDLPRYKMNVTYVDGTTQHFGFTRREWSFSADTPPQLIKYLEANGL